MMRHIWIWHKRLVYIQGPTRFYLFDRLQQSHFFIFNFMRKPVLMV
jgi:hypothetical protein